jgi:hypothetical protein
VAGAGVQQVTSPQEESLAVKRFAADGQEVMCQEPAPGQYGQGQALFDHGRLIAVHCSVKVGEGVGGSAAARLSVDHPQAREAVAVLGRELACHGGLTLDYFHVDGSPARHRPSQGADPQQLGPGPRRCCQYPITTPDPAGDGCPW